MGFSLVKRFIRDESAATTVEYAILLTVIVLAIAHSCLTLGLEMNHVFQQAAVVIESVVN